MTVYESTAWTDLNDYWRKKSEKSAIMPPKGRQAIEAASGKAKDLASATGGFVAGVAPQPVKNAGGLVVDWTLEPTVRAVLGLLELVTGWIQELTDEEQVFAHHRKNGHGVVRLSDLQSIDMEELDRYTGLLSLRWGTIGAAEGAVMGALAFVPIAGTVTSIGADLVVMHGLSTAIATRAAHAYGIDPTNQEEQNHLDRMLRKAWVAQAPKAGTVKKAADAFEAGAGRVRWSDKFRNDHRIAAAVEKLMKQASNGNHVPIDKVVSKLPALGVLTSAGINGAILGKLASTSVHYSQTVYLSEKYGLPMPANLT